MRDFRDGGRLLAKGVEAVVIGPAQELPRARRRIYIQMVRDNGGYEFPAVVSEMRRLPQRSVQRPPQQPQLEPEPGIRVSEHRTQFQPMFGGGLEQDRKGIYANNMPPSIQMMEPGRRNVDIVGHQYTATKAKTIDWVQHGPQIPVDADGIAIEGSLAEDPLYGKVVEMNSEARDFSSRYSRELGTSTMDAFNSGVTVPGQVDRKGIVRDSEVRFQHNLGRRRGRWQER